MNIERIVYDLVKSNKFVKNIIKFIYQVSFLPFGLLKKEYSKLTLLYEVDGFFGFHDRASINGGGLVISHRENFDVGKDNGRATILITSMKDPDFLVEFETNCCNYQQGSLATWFDEYSIIFNDQEGEHPVTKIINIEEQTITKKLPFHYFSKSNNNKLLSKVNFSRFGRGLDGYGYNVKYSKDVELDSLENVSISQISNLEIFDLDKNQVVFSISIKDAKLLSNHLIEDGYHYFSHSSFSPCDKYMYFLLRSSNEKRNSSQLLVVELASSKVTALNTGGMVSHLCWMNSTTINAYCSNDKHIDGYYTFDVLTGTVMASSDLLVDGHPISVTDNAFLTDTYPDRYRFQTLYFIDYREGKKEKLVSLRSPFKFRNTYRVDFHPRISTCGKYLSIDSSSRNKRTQRIYDINSLY